MATFLGWLVFILLGVGGVTSFLNWNAGKKNPWWAWATLGVGVAIMVIGIIDYFQR